jgi:GT2 family glycosyltransferase
LTSKQECRSRELSSVDCAVVIVTFNSADYIGAVLDSLPAAAPGLSLRVVVVDNGSIDDTADLVRQRSDATYVGTGANLGYAAAINVGRQHAGEYAALLVLNPDIEIEAGAIRELFGAVRGSCGGVAVPMLLDGDGHCYPSLHREPSIARAFGDALLGHRLARRPGWLSEIVWPGFEYEYAHPVDWATGAAILISAACDSAVGSWAEEFFLYSEETDYACRARAAGFRVQYEPSARVRHSGGGSGQSCALVALMAINRVRYVEKHGRWPLVYRGAVILNELLRIGDPGHRAAFRTVTRRSTWLKLVACLQNQSVGNDHSTRPGLDTADEVVLQASGAGAGAPRVLERSRRRTRHRFM